MASHARLVLEDLLTALRTDLGGNDLTTVDGTPCVVIADGGFPPVGPPYVLISAPSVESTYTAELTAYHVIGTCDWWAYTAAGTDSTEARAFAGLDFAAEIVAAVENAHADPAFTTLFGLTILLCSWDEVFSDEPDIAPGMALVHGTIRYETDLQRGG